jgi:hypothetical protein
MSHGFAVGVLAALCVGAVAACGALEPAAEVPAKAYTVEQLAAEVGCEPEFQGTASDFRQAGCTAGDKKYVLLDFTSEDKQRAWLDDALPYGGTYLVGERWIMSGSSPRSMEELRGKVGGTLESSADESATHHG